jgi:hypothetical protein
LCPSAPRPLCLQTMRLPPKNDGPYPPRPPTLTCSEETTTGCAGSRIRRLTDRTVRGCCVILFARRSASRPWFAPYTLRDACKRVAACLHPFSMQQRPPATVNVEACALGGGDEMSVILFCTYENLFDVCKPYLATPFRRE